MSDPKFQRGDLVRHRASGEVGVVVDANYYTEDGRDIYRSHLDKEDLPAEFNGDYDLDTGLRKDMVTVEEYLLERVDARGQLPSGKMVCCECGWSIDGDLGLIACASVAHAGEYPGHRVWLREHTP